jgi:hypothetical protein
MILGAELAATVALAATLGVGLGVAVADGWLST